jgi:aryl-alcohol dehydrogenase-like predicted oxidoreductase
MTMPYVNLGRTGLKVSRLGVGTMNFGGFATAAQAHAILDAAHDAGINLVDTADVYGWTVAKGLTEEIIGDWFAQGGGRRERTVLATKVYGTMPIEGREDWPNAGRLSALNIRRACEASLRRLKTDHIDLYQMHHIDRGTSWDEVWQAMEILVAQGKVLYVGSSNFAGWHIATAQAAAERLGLFGLVSEQSVYNLLQRNVELEVLPSAAHHGVGVLPYSPLEGGLLGGILRKAATADPEGRSAAAAAKLTDEQRTQLQAYEDLCGACGYAPGAVALAWLLSRPTVTAPIVGPRTRGQLQDVLAAFDVLLDEVTLAELDMIFPGRRAAPEDYAW